VNAGHRSLQTTAALAVGLLSLLLFVADVQTQSSSTGVAGGANSTLSSTASTAGALPFFYNITNFTINAVTPPNFPTQLCNTTDQGALAAWDNTTICIVVGGVAKMVFYPNVEDFSLLQIYTPAGAQGAFDLPTQWFQAEFSGVASSYKYRSDGGTNIVPFWTLIITLDDGYVSTIEWDDGCLGSCDPCVDLTCTIPISECTSQLTCDPKFYIGWYGTDRDGRYLVSAGKRYSRFRSYSLSSAFSNAYSSAASGASVAVPTDLTFTPTCGDGVSACQTNP